MLPVPTNPLDRAKTADPDSKFRCGALVYTKAGLFTLFTWLLWGDFCFSLMEAIWPNILPLMLKSEGSSNKLIALTLTTIPSAMNFVMNPIISTASDRYRGRRGRRIPFLLMASPFVALFLALLGFSPALGKMLHSFLSQPFPGISAASVTVGTICVLVASFRFFELFISIVFWYLFNDVVPTAFLGRFISCFRIMGSLAGALFNFFLFKYSESHTSVIFFGVAVLYGTVFTLMALNVKEGDYPPPEPVRAAPLHWFKIFFTECLSHPIFRWLCAYSTFLGLSSATNAFTVLMALSVGLTRDDFGKVASIAAVVTMVIMYPMGLLVDRFHPLRVMLASKIGFCLIVSINFVFLFHEFSKPVAFWIYAGVAALTIPILAANTAAGIPMVMRLFPKEKFGQFCAAYSMCAALGMMVGGAVAGIFLDLVAPLFANADYAYRLVPVWNVAFMFLALVAMVFVFREWIKLGGDKKYRPPIADSHNP